MKLKHYLMNQAEGGEGGGTGGAGDPPQTIDPAEYESLKANFEALQQEKEKLRLNNVSLLQEKVEAKKVADKAAMEMAKKSGDVDAVEKSWSEKYSALETSKTESDQRYERMIHSLTVVATASKLAAELAVQGSSEVLLPHISTRLAVEIKDDKPVVKVLDKEGRPSAMTVKELQAEFMANPIFAPIISGTKANGSGFKGNGWGGASGVQLLTRAEFDSMSSVEKSKIAPMIQKGDVKLVEARN